MAAGRNAREQFRRITRPPVAPLLITDGIEVTPDAIWLWVTIPEASTFLVEEPDLADATIANAAALAALIPAGADYHLKLVRAPHSSADYQEAWDQLDSVRAPHTDQYLSLGARRIDQQAAAGQLWRKIVLLGVRWPEHHATPKSPTAARLWWQNFIPTSPSRTAALADARARLSREAPDIRRRLEQFSRSTLAAVPTPASVIAWAYGRELRRAPLPTPGPPALPGSSAAQQLSTSSLVHLGHGIVDPGVSDRYLVVTDRVTGARRYVSVLVPAAGHGFPTLDLSNPGGGWLQLLGRVDGVEASVRGVNHGPVGSRVLLEKAAKVARSQIRESELFDAPTNTAAEEAHTVLEERHTEVTHRVDVLTTTHPRWVVDADTPEALADRVARLQETYDGIVDLQLVPDVQDLLWRELLPGDQVRVPEFGADQPMRTLAGSWFHGGSPFGDQTGPYLGINLGPSADPIRLHLASRTPTDKKMPTTVAFTGLSGSGKSTSLELFVLGLLAESAWVLLPDVKGDLGGIVRVAREVLGVPVQRIDVTDTQCAGMLDPMRFAPTADEARTLTLDVLMGALSTGDRSVGEIILEDAIDQVLRQPRDSWSTPAVLRHLTTFPGKDPTAETGRRLGAALQVRARSPQLRAVAADLPVGQDPLMTGRGLVYLRLDGLEFPHHTPDPEQWQIPQRCSMATLRVSLAYALHQSRRVRDIKKAVAIPELHLLMLYPEGRQFVDWLCRVGRALQTYLLLDSQSAVDLAKVVALQEQIVMAFCFRATSDHEQNAQGQLLGRPTPGPRLRHALRTLQIGECVGMDRRRRFTVMRFDRLTDQIAAALSTDPGDDTAPHHAVVDDLLGGELIAGETDGYDVDDVVAAGAT